MLFVFERLNDGRVDHSIILAQMPGRLESLNGGPPGNTELSELKPQAGGGLFPKQSATPRNPPIHDSTHNGSVLTIRPCMSLGVSPRD